MSNDIEMPKQINATKLAEDLRHDYELEVSESDIKRIIGVAIENQRRDAKAIPKLCPFCGGVAKLFRYDDEKNERYGIECTKCEMHVYCPGDETRIGVVKFWNQRTKIVRRNSK